MLGEAELAGEAVHGLGEDGAVGGAAASADGASATMEEAQGDAAFFRDDVEGAVSLVDLPCAGDHAAVLVGVGVAEHDFLAVIPRREQGLVGIARPQCPHDGGRVLQVFDGFEEGDGLQAGIVPFGFHCDSTEAGEPEDMQDVFGRGGSADDVLTDRFGGVGAFELRDGAEGVENLGGCGGESGWEEEPL